MTAPPPLPGLTAPFSARLPVLPSVGPPVSLKVKHVYERCGFDASSSPTTLYMLSDLEARLEDLLSDISQMPEEYVAKAEKVW